MILKLYATVGLLIWLGSVVSLLRGVNSSSLVSDYLCVALLVWAAVGALWAIWRHL